MLLKRAKDTILSFQYKYSKTMTQFTFKNVCLVVMHTINLTSSHKVEK